MASTLNLDEYTPNIAAEMTGEQLAKAKQVKMLGIVALILLVCSLIPILGFYYADRSIDLIKGNGGNNYSITGG